MTTQMPCIDTLGQPQRFVDRRRGLSGRGRMQHLAGVLLIALVAIGMLAPRLVAAQANVHDLYIVAHEDDDLLFMNPTIQNSIAAGHTVKVVYVTAGDACFGSAYWHGREAGDFAAYALMAGVANAWTSTPTPIQGYTLQEYTLDGRPGVSLVFFRLPSAYGEDGSTCGLGQDLEKLWLGTIPTIDALESTNTYTKQQLIDTLAALMIEFQPNSINTQDSSGQTACGPGDPSKCIIPYPNVGGTSYYYDHSDHYHTSLFALEARKSYAQPHTFRRYRGYSSALESANVTGADFTLKQDVMIAYAEQDANVNDTPPFGPFYDAWVARQYLVNSPPVAQCHHVSVNACGGVSASIDNGSSDPEGDPITLSQSPAGPYGLGSTLVTLTVTDSHNASSTCNGTVTVADQTPPTITCPSPQTATATSTSGAAVSFAPTASDNCGTVMTICTPASGSTFPIGSTAVTCTATDGAGLQNSCSFTVTVTATALMQTTALIATVDGLPVPPVVKLLLKAPLLVAKVALQNNRPQIACGSLRVFEGIVNELRKANKLTAAQASQLTTASQSIRATLGCP